MTTGPSIPPLVFAGPSISGGDVRALLPDAELRPPIRRGDLYTARMLRHSVFVILDGVFFQSRAVAPREVLDVVQDGGVVIGACSMGALRAAECWPAGMIGIGLIYRLFRAGILDSDDEVAVAVAGPHGHKGNSVPLVNMRYALGRCARAGQIPRAAAAALLATARETFYAERHWPTVFRKAGLGMQLEQWLPALQRWDLKHLDAVRALRYAAAFLRSDAAHGERPRTTRGPLVPNDLCREKSSDFLQGEHPLRLQRRLFEHLRDTGELTPHLPALLQRLRVLEPPEGEHIASQQGDESETLTRVAGALWDELEASGRLASEIFRLRAREQAARLADELEIEPDSLDLSLVETAYACRADTQVEPVGYGGLSLRPCEWPQVLRRLALTRSVKRRLFQQPFASCRALSVPCGDEV